MGRIVIGLVVGVVLGVIVVAGLAFSINAAHADTDSSIIAIPSVITNFDKIYKESLQAPFRNAGENIKDPDIKKFYQKLMDETGILADQPSTPVKIEMPR